LVFILALVEDVALPVVVCGGVVDELLDDVGVLEFVGWNEFRVCVILRFAG
jgi:hypothetical protein